MEENMKIKKIFILILTIILIFSIFSTTSFASVGDIVKTMEGVNSPTAGEAGQVVDVINIIIGLLQIGGTGIALIVITLMGIKYIMASPGEKADVKKQIMPIIFGCILLFGGMTLMSAVYKFSQEVMGAK